MAEKPVVSDGRVSTFRRYFDGKILTREDEESPETIELVRPPEGVPMASVSYGCTMTLNLGDYESLKLSCMVTLPTPVEELGEAWEAAKAFASVRLNKEIADAMAYRAARRGGGKEGGE